MYIHFKPDVYERLKFLATREEISVAAYVSRQMEMLAKDRVDVEYSFKEDDLCISINGPVTLTPQVYDLRAGKYDLKPENLISFEIKRSVGQSPT